MNDYTVLPQALTELDRAIRIEFIKYTEQGRPVRIRCTDSSVWVVPYRVHQREKYDGGQMRFLELYDAARTVRFHTTVDYTNTPRQSLTEHSWGVAMVCIELWGRLPEAWRKNAPTIRAELIKAALEHDLSEAWTGDMAANAKWRYPKLASALAVVEAEIVEQMGLTIQLSPLEISVLDWADKLELFIYSWKRHQAGMHGAGMVLSNIRRKLHTLQKLPGDIGSVFMCEVERDIDQIPSFMR